MLPHLLQLSNRTRLYDPHQQQQAPTPSAAALDYPPAEVKGAAAADADAEEEQEEEEQDAPPPLFVCPITQVCVRATNAISRLAVRWGGSPRSSLIPPIHQLHTQAPCLPLSGPDGGPCGCC